MTPGRNRKGHLGSTAATLLVAYLFILQGLAAGVGASSRVSPLFADAICLSNGSGPFDGGTGSPIRSSHHGDACCVVHCVTLGGATPPSAFTVATPPTLFHVTANLVFAHTLAGAEPATPPLGARAPPVVI